jgi:hypothetical protein
MIPLASTTARPDRPAVQLDAGLEKTLSAYTSAALAAGVSLLAATRASEAKVIYTPAHTKIPFKSSVPLDLNHDGVADFWFRNQTNTDHAGFGSTFLSAGCLHRVKTSSYVCNDPNNMVWGRGTFRVRFASALPAGYAVGPNQSYFQQAKGNTAEMARFPRLGSITYSKLSSGQWQYTKHRYLGLRFVIAGKIHFGWARVDVPAIQYGQGLVAVITGYAYETIPDKPIITGKTKGPDVITIQPATLGHLAAGASAIPVWRVKQTAATTH